MAVTLKASKNGLEIIDQARKKKGWLASASVWCDVAKTTPATLKRFRMGRPIQQEAFISICKAVGVENWEEIVDEGILDNYSTQPSESNEKSQVRWSLVLSGSLEEKDKSLVDAIVAHLQSILKDTSITLQRVDVDDN